MNEYAHVSIHTLTHNQPSGATYDKCDISDLTGAPQRVGKMAPANLPH